MLIALLMLMHSQCFLVSILFSQWLQKFLSFWVKCHNKFETLVYGYHNFLYNKKKRKKSKCVAIFFHFTVALSYYSFSLAHYLASTKPKQALKFSWVYFPVFRSVQIDVIRFKYGRIVFLYEYVFQSTCNKQIIYLSKFIPFEQCWKKELNFCYCHSDGAYSELTR